MKGRTVAAGVLLLLGAARMRGRTEAAPGPLAVDDLMAIQTSSMFSTIGSLSPDGQTYLRKE